MKTFLTMDGLYKGNYDPISQGNWMVQHYNHMTQKYEECYTWFECSACKTLDDIKELKRKAVDKMKRDFARDGVRFPYLMIHTYLRTYSHPDGEPSEMCYDDCTTHILESLLSHTDYKGNYPTEIYWDLFPYVREGNPHDWSDFEPYSPDSEVIMDFGPNLLNK